MNSWFVWLAVVLVALVLGLVGYYFSLRALRVTTGFAALAAVVYLTWYGFAHPAKPPPGNLSDAFIQGANALSTALFHWLPLPPGQDIPGPGRFGWLAIAVLLVIGYRELEAWALHSHARCLDTSALTDDQQNDSPGDGKDAPTDKRRHDQLAAELKFRLPAVAVRSPAILPGGSRSSELASIAEASGVDGSGLAGAIIRFFGMLWPNPRRVRVRVWVEPTAGQANADLTRVTVNLDDPRTGASIAAKTLAVSGSDAACVVAGYVAQHIFAEDPTAPPWCTGAADGRDLAATLLARQVRVYPESEQEVGSARSAQIRILENVADNNLCAGVARYELAHLYDLEGKHAEALLLHAKNREQYPRFYRGRYRLAMSLEMIANPDTGTKLKKEEVPKLDEALKILRRCHVTRARNGVSHAGDGERELPAELRSDLLDGAWKELQAIRKYLTMHHIIWRSFWHRDERGILKPYWRLRHRQGFYDGVCVALLLVAVRRALTGNEEPGSAPAGRPAEGARPGSVRRLHRARMVMRMATAIVGDSSDIATVLSIKADRSGHPSGQEVRPVVKILRPRRWPRQCSTGSWQAAYNLACVYAAIAQDCICQIRQLQASRGKRDDAQAEARRIAGELPGLARKVVTSLELAVSNPECEMERPWEWISQDPDFGCLHSTSDPFCGDFPDFLIAQKHFKVFLGAQKQRDYPPGLRARRGAAAVRPPATQRATPYARRGHRPAGVTSGGSGPGPRPPLPDGRRADGWPIRLVPLRRRIPGGRAGPGEAPPARDGA